MFDSPPDSVNSNIEQDNWNLYCQLSVSVPAQPVRAPCSIPHTLLFVQILDTVYSTPWGVDKPDFNLDPETVREAG